MNKEFTNSEKILLALLVCAVLYIIYKNCNSKKEGMTDTEKMEMPNNRSFTLEFRDDCIKFLNRDHDMVMKIDHNGNLSLTGVIDNIPKKSDSINRGMEALVKPLIGKDQSTEEETNNSMATMFGLSTGTVGQGPTMPPQMPPPAPVPTPVPVPDEVNNNNNNNNNGNRNVLAGLAGFMGDMEGFNTVGRNDAIEQFALI